MPEHAASVPSAAQARAAADRTIALKIISGGQTGVDRGALDAALQLGVPCGGWCPSGRLAEDGKIPDRYPVVELPDCGYAERTARNVADSAATLIIAPGPPMGGTYETIERCVEIQRPHLVIDSMSLSVEEATERAMEFVQILLSPKHSRVGMTTVLNVAGPRASQWPQGHDVAQKIVSALLVRLSRHGRAHEYSA